jgi:hypothetical protein
VNNVAVYAGSLNFKVAVLLKFEDGGYRGIFEL